MTQPISANEFDPPPAVWPRVHKWGAVIPLGGEEAEDDRGGGADALINRLISADRLAQSPDMGQTTENCELVQPRTTVHTVHALGAPIVGAGRRRGQHRQHGRRHVLRRLRRLAQMQAVAGLVELATRAQRSE